MVYLKAAPKRQNKYANRNRREVIFEINDPLYFKNIQLNGKLDVK
jgi:hypothetical protein